MLFARCLTQHVSQTSLVFLWQSTRLTSRSDPFDQLFGKKACL